jgi:hypothetical protein
MSAGVVCDQAITAAQQMLRALDDVPARRGQAVEQNDRRTPARRLTGQHDASGSWNLAQDLKRLRPHGAYTVTRGWNPL